MRRLLLALNVVAKLIFWVPVGLIGVVAIIVGLFLVLSAALAIWGAVGSFLSWRALDAETIQDRAEEYVLRYDIDHVAVCTYVVSCNSGRARLEPVDLDEVDFDALRDRIWGRRFRDECPGRTANLGLHLVPIESADGAISPGLENAYWLFGGDRFAARSTNWSGGSFSEEPWKRCTPEDYAFVRSYGVIRPPVRPAPEGEY